MKAWIKYAAAAFALFGIFYFVKWASGFESMVIFGFVLSILPTPSTFQK